MYSLPINDKRQTTEDEGEHSAVIRPSSFVLRPVVRYRLRDWLISRQRYWGPPIPIIYCDSCGTVPVPEDQLPVLLPPLEQFRPTGAGVSPLATVEAFVNTACPTCGGAARRETDVSDNFLDSAWYFLRYLSTERDDVPWDSERVRRWLPVGLYTGGPEHATMHHLYARFISMALFDLGHTPIEEPFARLRLHGTITKDGRKMSKSRGNVVNPDAYISRYGADVTRMALLFLGPFDEDADFSDRGVVGMARFLSRVWELCATDRGRKTNDESNIDAQAAPVSISDDPSSSVFRRSSFVKRVTEELEQQRFHTAIAALMEFANWLRGPGGRLAAQERNQARRTLVALLAPFAPHLAEELWQQLGGSGSIHDQPWPVAVSDAADRMIELPVQVNGRLRDRISIAALADHAAISTAALASPKVREAVGGQTVQRVVVVPGRVVNVVLE
jgi:leucyl-tRNA synthetase